MLPCLILLNTIRKNPKSQNFDLRHRNILARINELLKKALLFLAILKVELEGIFVMNH